MIQKLLLLSYLFLQSLLMFNQEPEKITNEALTGKWYSVSGTDTFEIEFLNNNRVKKKYSFFPFEMEEGYFSDYYQKWIDYETFQIEKEDDQLFLNVYSPDQDLLEKNQLFYLGNKIVMVSTKWWITDISLHIDEILLLEKADSLSNKKDITDEYQSAKYYLPAGFSEMIYIVYDQKTGQREELDTHGNRILRIPESGILYTQFKPAPLTLVLKNQEFFFISDSSEVVNKVDHISYHENSDTSLINQLKFRDEQMMVISYGFNQESRVSLNARLGEEIKGNVEFLEVISYKEIKKRIHKKGYL